MLKIIQKTAILWVGILFLQ